MENIKHKMAERDLTVWLGGENRVSEILNRKLTTKIMKVLHDNLGLSTKILLVVA